MNAQLDATPTNAEEAERLIQAAKDALTDDMVSRLSATAARFSAMTSASKCAVEPALEMGRLVVSPSTSTFLPCSPSMCRVARLVGTQPFWKPAFSTTSMPLCAGMATSRSYLVSLPSSLFSTLLAPSTSFMLKSVS